MDRSPHPTVLGIHAGVQATAWNCPDYKSCETSGRCVSWGRSAPMHGSWVTFEEGKLDLSEERSPRYGLPTIRMSVDGFGQDVTYHFISDPSSAFFTDCDLFNGAGLKADLPPPYDSINKTAKSAKYQKPSKIHVKALEAPGKRQKSVTSAPTEGKKRRVLRRTLGIRR